MTTATMIPTVGTLARRSDVNARNRYFALALLGASLMAFAASNAHAHADRVLPYDDDSFRRYDTWNEGRLVDVQVRVDGEAAPLYVSPNGDDRRYVQAFAGRNYSLVLRNNTGRRVAVVLAVDGLNVLNGDITNLSAREPMYVLDANETATIRGWRTSLNEIRRFNFVDERRSYAERTGQANSDMGWIRVVSFREQLPWWESRGPQVRDRRFKDEQSRGAVPEEMAPQAKGEDKLDAAPAPTRSTAPQAQDNLARGESENGGSFPGTGWGERKEDRVQRTQFNPNPVAVDRLVIRYEYGAALRALGIIPTREWRRDRLDERDGQVGFARPPRRW